MDPKYKKYILDCTIHNLKKLYLGLT